MSAQRNDDMPLARLERMIAAYGADPKRWPQGERAAAEELVARWPAARDLLSRARPLDDALDAIAADLPEGAMNRLMAATAFPPPRPATPSFLDRLTTAASAFWPRAAVLAGMAALGIVVGLSTEPAYSGYDTASLIAADTGTDIVEELAP